MLKPKMIEVSEGVFLRELMDLEYIEMKKSCADLDPPEYARELLQRSLVDVNGNRLYSSVAQLSLPLSALVDLSDKALALNNLGEKKS